MLNYSTYEAILDDIIDEKNLSEVLIMEGEEEPMTAVQKHVGYCIKVLMNTNRIDKDACHNFMNYLLKRFGGPYACRNHAINDLNAVNRAIILFLAYSTEFDGNYGEFEDCEEEDDDDDFGAMDPFIDINP